MYLHCLISWFTRSTCLGAREFFWDMHSKLTSKHFNCKATWSILSLLVYRKNMEIHAGFDNCGLLDNLSFPHYFSFCSNFLAESVNGRLRILSVTSGAIFFLLQKVGFAFWFHPPHLYGSLKFWCMIAKLRTHQFEHFSNTLIDAYQPHTSVMHW